MRLDAATVAAMRERIIPLDTETVRESYRAGRFPRADAVKDLDMRYRWDLFYAAKCGELLDGERAGVIVRGGVVSSGGVTSAHIDTALRRIVAPLGVTA